MAIEITKAKVPRYFRVKVDNVRAELGYASSDISNWLADRLPSDQWEVRFHPTGLLAVRIDDDAVAVEFYLYLKQ